MATTIFQNRDMHDEAERRFDDTEHRWTDFLFTDLVEAREWLSIIQQRSPARQQLHRERLDRMNSRLDALDAATHCVFNTHELLEQILLYLPMNDQLALQWVNQTFSAIIKRSPAIQRALCFQMRRLPKRKIDQLGRETDEDDIENVSAIIEDVQEWPKDADEKSDGEE